MKRWVASQAASLVVVGAGILLVIDGPWAFDQLWVVLGLAGYLSTFVTGVAVLKPRGDRIAETIARDGGMTPVALAETRRLLALARIDYVTLFLVIADMAIKPTGDDVALLIAVAAIFAAGLAWAIGVAQSVTVPESAPASG